MTLLDYMEGQNLRNQGCQAVLQSQGADWSQSYARNADLFLAGRKMGDTFTGEDVRVYVSRFIAPPSHPNAWGAAARSVLTRWKKNRFIEECGLGVSKLPKSHASRLPLYRVVA